jgi:hypothetical protein
MQRGKAGPCLGNRIGKSTTNLARVSLRTSRWNLISRVRRHSDEIPMHSKPTTQKGMNSKGVEFDALQVVEKDGAGDRDRTGDQQLGRLRLYH